MATRKKKSKPKASRAARSRISTSSIKTRRLPHGPMHRWRPCPKGEHWVREHDRTVPPSEKNPDGSTDVRGHCRKNRSHKDQLYPEEVENMAREFFPGLDGPPSSNKLGFDEPDRQGDAYDDLIRGWTMYWNDILEPQESLDPNLVKALIVSWIS